MEFDHRPSPRCVRLIAEIERLSGNWDRLKESEALASPDRRAAAIRGGVHAMLMLDVTYPLDQRKAAVGLEAAHELGPLSFTFAELAELYQVLTGGGDRRDSQLGAVFRTIATDFESPDELEESIFPTVSPFLIERRLRELLEWIRSELELRTYHPLILAAAFHVLFLQIHPFPRANHRMAFVLLWHLLNQSGFDFVAYDHIAVRCNRRRGEYFSALRRAERTTHGTWHTLNGWLEFLLEVVRDCGEMVMHQANRQTEARRLTDVQQQIVEVIRSVGPATRDAIVRATGINESTVKYNLGVLTRKGHLQRSGGGRTTNYQVI
ncbi:MAG: Fic family protein [Bdellovibrionales bacterium]|nr:Fic family protein [Bdellovibrionales bacterium]